MTVKDVIAKYQRGEIGYAVPDQEPQLAFDFVTENDITDVRETLRGNHAQSSTDLQRRLASRGTHVSKPTWQKAIKAAGFTASKPRYGQMIRQPNKEKRVEFCQKLILDNDNFDNIIWTDECTIQLHDNKVVIYRPIDGMTHTIPKPKHPCMGWYQQTRTHTNHALRRHPEKRICCRQYYKGKPTIYSNNFSR